MSLGSFFVRETLFEARGPAVKVTGALFGDVRFGFFHGLGREWTLKWYKHRSIFSQNHHQARSITLHVEWIKQAKRIQIFQ